MKITVLDELDLPLLTRAVPDVGSHVFDQLNAYAAEVLSRARPRQ